MHLGSQLARVQSDSGPSFTVEALASVLKPGLISKALETFGKHSERIRKLPAPEGEELASQLVDLLFGGIGAPPPAD